MAVDYAPLTWLSGYSSDATNLKITWASLPASVTSEPDIRNILRDISGLIEAHYNALVADELNPDDVPTKFLPTTNTKYNESTLEFEEQHGQKFDLTVDSTSLADEA
jgi:hypothetical protein